MEVSGGQHPLRSRSGREVSAALDAPGTAQQQDGPTSPLVTRPDPAAMAVSAPAALNRGPRAWQLGEGPMPVQTPSHPVSQSRMCVYVQHCVIHSAYRTT